MYATDPGRTPATITAPAPTKDSPAAGTTGLPIPGRGDGKLTAEDLPVPAAVVGWAVLGLAIVVTARYGLRNGAVA